MKGLKKCPFCGSDAGTSRSSGFFFAWCENQNCGTQMEVKETESEAIDAWNHRPAGDEGLRVAAEFLRWRDGQEEPPEHQNTVIIHHLGGGREALGFYLKGVWHDNEFGKIEGPIRWRPFFIPDALEAALHTEKKEADRG